MFTNVNYIITIENGPIHFAYNTKVSSILENSRIGSSLGIYKVVEYNKSGVSYTLKATQDERSELMFSINTFSAQIKTIQNIDRENIDIHYFKIIATYRKS